MVEFADFECPYCARYTHVLESLLARYPEDVAVVYRHWPLSNHRFAYPAARASECAAAQGRFLSYHDVLYARQDSLGLLPFDEVALRAGVPDLPRFRECNASSAAVPAIDADSAMARTIGGRGTPAVVVNGMLLGSPPDSARLDALVKRVLAGERLLSPK